MLPDKLLRITAILQSLSKEPSDVEMIVGKYGLCVIDDCVPYLPYIGRYEMFNSDPPYNEGCAKVFGEHYVGERNGTENYEDLIDEVDYRRWCDKWFESVSEICERGMFTCGRKHLSFWLNKPGTDYGIIYYPNSAGSSNFSKIKCFEPYVVFGNFNEKPLTRDLMVVTKLNGFIRVRTEKRDFKTVHPHAKPPELYRKVLAQQRPKSVLDIFMGAGTTARVCEALHINWLGFEKERKYRTDIENNINIGGKEGRVVVEKLARRREHNV